MVINNITAYDAEIIAKEIFNGICEYYTISSVKAQSITRKREIVEVRQMSMTFIYTILKKHLSLAVTGRIVGHKDHATVLHAIKTIHNLCDTNRDMRIKYDECEEIATRIYNKRLALKKKQDVVLSTELSKLLQKDYSEIKSGIENLLTTYNLEIVL